MSDQRAPHSVTPPWRAGWRGAARRPPPAAPPAGTPAAPPRGGASPGRNQEEGRGRKEKWGGGGEHRSRRPNPSRDRTTHHNLHLSHKKTTPLVSYKVWTCGQDRNVQEAVKMQKTLGQKWTHQWNLVIRGGFIAAHGFEKIPPGDQ